MKLLGLEAIKRASGTLPPSSSLVGGSTLPLCRGGLWIPEMWCEFKVRAQEGSGCKQWKPCCLKTLLYRNQESIVPLNLADKALREQALVQWLLSTSSLHLAADGGASYLLKPVL